MQFRELLNRDDTYALRGVCMLLIIAHHCWLAGVRQGLVTGGGALCD